MTTKMTNKTFTRILFCLLALMPMAALAQTADDQNVPQRSSLFAYFSYNKVLESMPEMADVDKSMAELKAQYDAELKRAEEEFNKKYEEFLEGQRNYAASIYKKRQAELTDLLEKNAAFKAEAQRLLGQARREAVAPLKRKVVEAVGAIGKKNGYAFILNSDNNTLTYVDPVLGDDITQEILTMVGAAQ